MSQRNFEKLNDKGSQLIAESNRITDITDSKWGHPDGADFWYIDPALNVETATLYNPEVSDEEKLKLEKRDSRHIMISGGVQNIPAISKNTKCQGVKKSLTHQWKCG